MIKFKEIKLQNFRSYKEILFHFDSKGFNLISGKNGIGKSTIFRGLIWCLIGVDSEGIKGTDLKSWHFKGITFAELKFSYNDKDYTLYRQQSPNKLRLNGKDVDQKDVDDIFSFNMKLFNYIAYMSQFASQFIEAKSSEKLEIFTKILELEKWDEYSEKSKGRASKYKETLIKLNSDVSRLEGKKEVLAEQNYEQEIKEFANRQKEKIDRINNEIARIDRDLEKNEDEIDTQKKDYIKLTDHYEEISIDTDKVEELDHNLEVFNKANKDINVEIYKTDLSIENLESKVKKIEKNLKVKTEEFLDKKDTTCNSCGQVITEKHAREQIRHLKLDAEGEILDIETEVKNKFAEIKEYRLAEEENKLSIKQIEQERDEFNDQIEEMKELEQIIQKKYALIESLNKTSKNFENELEKLEFEIDSIKKQKNPFIVKNEKVKKELFQVNEALNDKNKQINMFEMLKTHYEYWIKAFKEIKLHITENSIKEFNVFCNDNLMKLGLIGWEIENSIDKVLKTGGIKKGFTTLIKSPNHDKEVNIKCFSGGEQQRIKIAMILAFIDFLNSKIDMNIEAYDEPTQWCDVEGINALLEILESRSDKKGVYLIDHRVLSEGVFDKIFEISRDGKESKIKEVSN